MKARVFFSYSHSDANFRDELEKHLKILQRRGLIEIWNDKMIPAGEELDSSISVELERADVILLLISVDFINSNYCYDIELKRALERHDEKEAIVIPVILRPCAWQKLSFGKLKALPKDGHPVVKHSTLDDAFLDITNGIENAIDKISKTKNLVSNQNDSFLAQTMNYESQLKSLPRSSNLAIPRKFTDHDKDDFVTNAFEYIANYFEGSLKELENRYPLIRTKFERVDTRSFESTIYFDGVQKGKCGVWLGALTSFERGTPDLLFSSNGLSKGGNSCNETMSVKDNGNFLGLTIGFGFNTSDSLLTIQGAAEQYWSKFFDPIKNSI